MKITMRTLVATTKNSGKFLFQTKASFTSLNLSQTCNIYIIFSNKYQVIQMYYIDYKKRFVKNLKVLAQQDNNNNGFSLVVWFR